MKVLQKDSIPAVVEVLAKRGARPFTIMLSTEPNFLKKSRKLGDPLPPHLLPVRKVSVVNCFLNFDYESAVNRQRTREDSNADFQAKANWFNHTSIKAIVASKNEPSKLYVQLKVQAILSVEYVGANGQTWTREEFEELYGDYLPAKSKSKGQGLASPVLTMTPNLDSITSFRVDGETYVIGKEVCGKQVRGHSPLSFVKPLRLITQAQRAALNDGEF